MTVENGTLLNRRRHIKREDGCKTVISLVFHSVGISFNLITDNPHISQEEMGKKLGLTVDGIRYHTDKLKKQGFLERVGGKKEGHWQIIEKS